jgi:hypothetical protein
VNSNLQSHLKLWLDASNTDGRRNAALARNQRSLSRDMPFVETWLDLSGHGNHFVVPDVNKLLGYYRGAVKSAAASVAISSELHRLARFSPEGLVGYSDSFDERRVVTGDSLVDTPNPSTSMGLTYTNPSITKLGLTDAAFRAHFDKNHDCVACPMITKEAVFAPSASTTGGGHGS